MIDLLQGASQDQAAFVLTKPREALALVHGMPTALKDPRLSRAGELGSRPHHPQPRSPCGIPSSKFAWPPAISVMQGHRSSGKFLTGVVMAR